MALCNPGADKIFMDGNRSLGYFVVVREIPLGLLNNVPHFHAAIAKYVLQFFVSGDIELLDRNTIGLI